MNLCLILVSIILIGDLCAAADFYLEVVKPIADGGELIEKMITRGTGENRPALKPEGREEAYTVTLYACSLDDGVPYKIVYSCVHVIDQQNKQNVYEVENFYAVKDLEVSACYVKIHGEYYDTVLPQVLTASIEQRDLLPPPFMVGPTNSNNVEYEVQKFLEPFTKQEPISHIKRLVAFLAINHFKGFDGWNAFSRMLFDPYVALLKKIINASGYEAYLEGRNPQPTVFTRSLHRTETPPQPQSRTQSPSRPRKQRRLSPCLSGLKDKSRALLKFRSRSKTQSQALPKSQSLRKSGSWLSRIFSGSQAKVTPEPQPQSKSPPSPRSPISSQTRYPSRSVSLSVSKSDMLVAASYLSFKMFDPCFMKSKGYLELKQARDYCTVYCQFLSATGYVYGQSFSEQCDTLKLGYCEKNMCKCVPQNGENVNMVFCNNALRLRIYRAGLS